MCYSSFTSTKWTNIYENIKISTQKTIFQHQKWIICFWAFSKHPFKWCEILSSSFFHTLCYCVLNASANTIPNGIRFRPCAVCRCVCARYSFEVVEWAKRRLGRAPARPDASAIAAARAAEKETGCSTPLERRPPARKHSHHAAACVQTLLNSYAYTHTRRRYVHFCWAQKICAKTSHLPNFSYSYRWKTNLC